MTTFTRFPCKNIREFGCPLSEVKNIKLNRIDFNDPELLCEGEEKFIHNSLGDKYKHILEKD